MATVVPEGLCIWGNCGKPARWQIGILIWAIGTPTGMRTKKRAAHLMWNVTCCDECRLKAKAADFLLPEGRERIATGIHRAGGAPPDFTTAQLTFDEIVDRPVDIKETIADVKRRGGTIIEA
jgi:hypothetical protein